jgi:hypothetical protein
VTGAPDGTWLAGATVTVCVTVTPACGLDVADAAAEDTPGVPDADAPSAEADVPEEADVAEEADVPEEAEPPEADVPPVTVGEMIVGVVGEEDEVQAETVTGASRIRAPQHSAVSLAPNGVPAVVPRTFIDPPPAPGI